ncbi:MAG: hypothetical protein JWM44_2454 [Bacilli bacterium]|jgi:hypothetical protein|nr:hypothetical protein [Bacilli bacterium]
MYRSGYQLKSDVDFDNAIIFHLIISITQQDMHIGSGYIKSHNSEVVTLADVTVSKELCEFKICL